MWYWKDRNIILGNKLTVIFVPSLYLLSQTFNDWINQSYVEKAKIKYILVGSDADVDEGIKFKANGLLLCIDPNEIRKQIDNIEDKLVVICTYQSSDKLSNACNKEIEFDFGIFDEAHKTVGQVSKKFSMMLDDNKLVIKKRLFMTATPKMYKSNLDEVEDIISMDNEEYYGEDIYRYNTGNAINDKNLVDYQLLTIITKNTDIKNNITQNKLVTYKDNFADEESHYLAHIIIILKKIHETCNHMITYHNSVAGAEKFCKFLKELNKLLYPDKDLYINSLDGSISMSKRKKIVREYENNEKGILCSAKVLNEGVNIPIVDSVCFIDGRSSTIDIVQCIGRSLRLHNKKKIAYVLVPVFLENLEEDFDKYKYGNIIEILKALKSTDDGVIEYFVTRNSGKITKRKLMHTERFNKVDISDEIDMDEWLANINGKIWDIVDPFENMLQRVIEWVEKNKRIPSLSSKDEIEYKLGQWCASRRRDKRKARLREDKAKKIEQINHWYWNVEDSFDKTYLEVKEWAEKNKRIPYIKSKNIVEDRLGKWCAQKRKDKKRGRLNEEKIRKLTEIDHWFWGEDTVKEIKSFDERYSEVKKWADDNKRIPSEKSKDIIEKILGRWCSSQRYRKKIGALGEDKIKKLDEITNWYWSEDTTKEIVSFDEMYLKVKEWANTNKRIPSASGAKDEYEKRLGIWCGNKRKNKKIGILDEEKIQKLEQIENWYWGEDTIKELKSFDEIYVEVKTWAETHNKIPSMGSKDKIEKKLGSWCTRQRLNKKKGKLDEETITKLEQINCWYWEAPDLFEETYLKLKEWVENNKKIPSTGSKDQIEYTLGNWCCDKRSDKRNGKLCAEKIKKLEEINHWYWGEATTIKPKSFDEMYSEVNEWVKQNKRIPNGKCEDPIEKKLGNWCAWKRQRREKLDVETIKKLEKINYWYWPK